MNRHALRIGVLTAVTAAVTAATATPALADVQASASISLGRLTFTDKPGAYDVVLDVRSEGASVTFDAQYTIAPFAGCSYPVATDLTKVKCTGTWTSLSVHGGDGNDRVDLDLPGLPDFNIYLYGEAGNDVLLGSQRHEGLDGGPGNDELWGRNGNDWLMGKEGADRMFGGAGHDAVEYLGYPTTGVHATADGVIGDDGMPGEGDTVGSDVEDLIGTRYDDVLGGNSADNRILACDGADTIYTYGGDDTIEEGDGGACGSDGSIPAGADYMDGGSGTDWVYYGRHPAGVVVTLDDAVGNDGAPGEGDSLIGIENVSATDHDDILIGNAAANTFHGGLGADTLFGLDGADRLYGNRDDDTIYGGNGDDRLYGDHGADRLIGNSGTDVCDVGTDGGTRTSCEL